MDFSPKRRAVVTGGAHGIGLATVEHLRSLNYDVIVMDQDLHDRGGIEVDLGHSQSVEEACASIEGPIHLLVNNAGIGGSWKGILETTEAEWDQVLNVNLKAAWLMVKHLAPKLPNPSSIVNIASTRATMSEPNTEPYSASKGGLIALTHALAISLGVRGIRVNCISPGWINVSDSPLRAIDHTQHPAGRVGRPEDIAAVVSFLASDQSGFITGANFVVDGGMTRKMIYLDD